MALKISLLQYSSAISNITENKNKILQYLSHTHSDVVITPELFLSSYLISDYLYNLSIKTQILNAIDEIAKSTINYPATLLLGTPYWENNILYNSCLIIQNGKIAQVIHKSKLPNYGVFNEYRYFTAKEDTNNVFIINNIKLGILVCEDTWQEDKIIKLASQKPDLVISINASPFELNKYNSRMKVLNISQKYMNVPTIYLNTVGGQDDVVFDGHSIILNKNMEICSVLPAFLETDTQFTYTNGTLLAKQENFYQNEHENSLIYNALIKGTQDFIINSGFKGAFLGISGGLDSTFIATLACDALGTENVFGLSMPSTYTSCESFKVIEQIKTSLNIDISEVPITNIYKTYEETLHSHMDLSNNHAGENLQARIRGQILMAFSNANSSHMLLTTSNKSEIATGYSTIYGDSCGFFNPIKDLYKTQIQSLAAWRNNNIPNLSKNKILNVIPNLAITRKPTAELANNQYDENSLMDYKTLDAILYGLIEKNQTKEELSSQFDANLVEKTFKLLHNSQYKRVQSALGLKISNRPFGKDFQYPLTKKIEI